MYFFNVKPVLVFLLHKYLILGRTLDKHTLSSSSTELRQSLLLKILMIKKGDMPILFFDVSCKLQIWEIESVSDYY
jgi:hypothetical protein